MSGQALEVSDFKFRLLRKVRVSESGRSGGIANGLAVSSLFQLGIVAKSANELTLFSLSDVQNLHSDSSNINKEVNDLPNRSFQIDSNATICALSANCSGKLLAVLCSTPNGPFVYIYDIESLATKSEVNPEKWATFRIGSEFTALGLALQWNPALEDVLAASATDHTVVVVKVDTQSRSKVSMIGEKRFGAATRVFSWSPKGKHICIGDSVGKMCQLKPELEVLRTVMCPDFLQGNFYVCGLCWLSTTEWVIAYTDENKLETFFLNIKKDKPPQWTRVGDLSYVTPSCPATRFALFNTDLLLSWNVILSGTSAISEVVPIGKWTAQNEWQVWGLDEEGRIDLPTTFGNSNPSFPLAMAVDLSSSRNVVMNNDGLSLPPAPIIFVLSTDGVIIPYHILSTNPLHKSAQIKPQSTPKFVSAPPAATSVNEPMASFSFKTAPTTTNDAAFAMKPAEKPTGGGLFGMPVQQQQQIQGQDKPKSGLFGGILGGNQQDKPAATSGLFGSGTTTAVTQEKPKQTLFGGSISQAQTTAPTSTPTPAPALTVAPNITQTQAQAAEQPRPRENQEELRKKAERETKANALKQMKEECNRAVEEALNEWRKADKEVGIVGRGLQHMAKAVNSLAEEWRDNSSDEVFNELSQEVNALEQQLRNIEFGTKELLKDTTKKTMLCDSQEEISHLMQMIQEVDNYDRTARAEMVVEKFEEYKAKIAITRKMLADLKAAKKKPIQKSSTAEVRDANEEKYLMKAAQNVNRGIAESRKKIFKAEENITLLKRRERVKCLLASVPGESSAAPVELHSLPATAETRLSEKKVHDIVAAQNQIRAFIISMSAQPKRILPLKVQQFESTAPPKALNKTLDASILETSIAQMLVSPRRHVPMSDASTQANVPLPKPRPVPVVSEPPAPTPTAPSQVTSIPSTTAVQSSNVRPSPTFSTPSITAAAVATSTVTTSTPLFSFKNQPATTATATSGSPSSIFTTPKIEDKTAQGPDGSKEKTSIFGTPKEPEKTAEAKSEVRSEKADENKGAAPPSVSAASANTPPAETKSSFSFSTPEKNKPAEPKEASVPVTSASASSAFAPSQVSSTPAPTTTSSDGFGSLFKTAVTTTSSTSSSLFGGATVTSPSTATTTVSSIFGGTTKPVTTAASSGFSSIFGGDASKAGSAAAASQFSFTNAGTAQPTADTAPKPSSIFGGSSAFGGSAASNANAAPASSVSFSFKTGSDSAPKPEQKSVFGGSFQTAASAAAEEGMMDDDLQACNANTNGQKQSSGLFGGAFMSGMGSSSPSSNANRNVFGGSVLNASNASNSPGSNSWLFKSSTQNQPTSPSSGGAFSSFGAAAKSVSPQQQSASPFGAMSSASPSSAFGGAPVFGAKPAFGQKPTFGAGSSFGGMSALSQPQQPAAAPSSGSGFAAFASNSASFTAGASGQSSLFGDRSFRQLMRKLSPLFSISTRHLSLNEVSVALRPFYFAVHQDRFARNPEVRDENEKSLQIFNGYLNDLFPVSSSLRPMTIRFSIAKEPEGLKQITINLRGTDAFRIVKQALESCDASTANLSEKMSSESVYAENGSETTQHSVDLQHDLLRNYLRMKKKGMKSNELLHVIKNHNARSDAINKTRNAEMARATMKDEIDDIKQRAQLKDIVWGMDWAESHMRRCLMNVHRLIDYTDASDRNVVLDCLYRNTLRFGRGSFTCCDGSIQLGADHVLEQWRKACMQSVIRRKQLPELKESVNQLKTLTDASTILMPYQKGLAQALSQIQTLLVRLHSKSHLLPQLKTYGKDGMFEVVTSYDELAVGLDGRIYIPCNVDVSSLISFLADNKAKAENLQREFTRLTVEVDHARMQIVQELRLNSLELETGLPLKDVLRSMERLLRLSEEDRSSLVGLSLILSINPFVHVTSSGKLSLPLDWV
ncbi:hypothetical protein WR25_14930 [Diploscapter pachys]|uniref:Nuclear pore complex protein Nup214 phenylalanine-glycine (FG) domain-containing protein n=1 Tax=Diploscapter pachys TaxID=2018661 RepID=A0A2A2LRW7_9BILA|nr:hypothetical protein WR25_14930 [Diploscapter pachys]